MATGARGRGGGLKRPSRRPSGPGKMTDGIGVDLQDERGSGGVREVSGYIVMIGKIAITLTKDVINH